MRLLAAVAALALVSAGAGAAEPLPLPQQPPAAAQAHFLDDLSRRTFAWFWETADADTGLVPNRHPGPPLGTSIGGMGFALTAWGIGAERGYVSREQAADITLRNLRTLYNAPQGEALDGMAGRNGFYYHFLDLKTAARASKSELSTVDTALYLMGVLFAQSYFDRDNPVEAEIRDLAEKTIARVDWHFAQRAETRAVIMGHRPERGGWGKAEWDGYNEALIVYALALGSPARPLGKDAYANGWSRNLAADWGTLYGQEHLTFEPLFGHQYSHAWIDFRGIKDDFISARGIDYFENSRRATLAQYAYAQANPNGWTGYGGNIWGWTASDGPARIDKVVNGKPRRFWGYIARGIAVDPAKTIDDGTIAPTAAGGSIPFAPEVTIPALMEMKERFGSYVYDRHGFADAFNMSFTFTDVPVQKGKVHAGFGWVDGDKLVIDQGAILLMVENHRSDLVWKVMRKNPHLRRGLERMGFKGGWLDDPR